MDWTRVKEIRSIDRREDARRGFVAYITGFGGGSGLTNMRPRGVVASNETYALVVEIWKGHGQ